jgi:hypothetical protein
LAYSTVLDVTAIVDTDMTDPEITKLINRTDARIDLTVGAGINVLLLEDLSTTWTALRVMLKDPNARGLGEYTERREVTMKMLKDEVDDMLELADGGISFTAASESLG